MPILAISQENQRPTWKMNAMKMRKVLKSEKYMRTFAKISTEMGKLS